MIKCLLEQGEVVLAPYTMASAMDFLPSNITTLINFANNSELNFGSGKILR